MEIKDIDVILRESFTHKAKRKEGTNTFPVDTSEEHLMYQLEIYKNYYDMESREEVVDQLIKDLRDLANYLEQVREKEKNSRKEEREID